MPTRAATMLASPAAAAFGYATYVRSTVQPAQAHPELMTVQGTDQSGRQRWRKMNNGLGLVDVGRSCGGL
ncbi:hypothetical protein DM01DRAFT_1283298 [Hesseltinella vesiculosa]|uniref:Uncharacterized protein n=1 Tax=Hesseltinella vesiculosa TaxID=101127 RepID=A0A1X2GPB0_9FUNG|nr:hypothetical protein DM01DRAFT_1283298 [Hesseltinella vesiculosa]